MLLVSRPALQQQPLLSTISVGRVASVAVISVRLVIAAVGGPFPSSSPSWSMCVSSLNWLAELCQVKRVVAEAPKFLE